MTFKNGKTLLPHTKTNAVEQKNSRNWIKVLKSQFKWNKIILNVDKKNNSWKSFVVYLRLFSELDCEVKFWENDDWK